MRQEFPGMMSGKKLVCSGSPCKDMGFSEPEETKVSPVCLVGRTLVCRDSALLCNWMSLLEIEGDLH